MLPEGTLYCKGKPWHWGELTVKGDSILSSQGDFWMQSLNTIDSFDCGEWVERQETMLKTGCSYPLDTSIQRDGCFDQDDLFLVYELKDLRLLRYLIDKAIDNE